MGPRTRLGKLRGTPGQALGQVEDGVLLLGVLGERFGDHLSKQTRVLWLSHRVNLAEGESLSGKGICDRSSLIVRFLLGVTVGGCQ